MIDLCKLGMDWYKIYSTDEVSEIHDTYWISNKIDSILRWAYLQTDNTQNCLVTDWGPLRDSEETVTICIKV